MIKGLIKYVNDLNKNYVIFDIGARDCFTKYRILQ